MIEEGTAIRGTGRRKSSVASVRLVRGTGVVKINSRDLDAFFPIERDQASVLSPLKATKTLGKFDVLVKVTGGGATGQAGAVMLGVARALLKVGGENSEPLRDGGFLTRDGRMKERKKYGQRGARRGFQFSKR